MPAQFGRLVGRIARADEIDQILGARDPPGQRHTLGPAVDHRRLGQQAIRTIRDRLRREPEARAPQPDERRLLPPGATPLVRHGRFARVGHAIDSHAQAAIVHALAAALDADGEAVGSVQIPGSLGAGALCEGFAQQGQPGQHGIDWGRGRVFGTWCVTDGQDVPSLAPVPCDRGCGTDKLIGEELEESDEKDFEICPQHSRTPPGLGPLLRFRGKAYASTVGTGFRIVFNRC